MEKRFKQRILGIIVLVILLAVVLLLLFTGAKRNLPSTGVNANIPQEASMPEEQVVFSQSQPAVWAVQLASFSEKVNADNLIKKLQDTGFNAYITAKQEKHGIIYKVYVGPESNKSNAEDLLKKLKDNFQLKGIVVKYRA